MMNNPWLPEEDGILRSIYPQHGLHAACDALPRHTPRSIMARAQRLRIKSAPTPMTRFNRHIDRSGPVHNALGTPCWLWTGTKNKSGYGRQRVGSKVHTAHRLSWELHHGTIPGGMCVCHRCDNPPCVNPDHLFLGTREENNEDRDAKGRTQRPRGEANPQAKLRAVDAVEIRRRHEAGETQHQIASAFGLTQGAVSKVVRGATWSEAYR